MKKTIIIQQHLKESIKEGDFVKIWDGSAFSVEGHENLYIVESKPEIFGTKKLIKDLVFEVILTNVFDAIIEGGIKDSFYRQDLILKLVNSDLKLTIRTASEFVINLSSLND